MASIGPHIRLVAILAIGAALITALPADAATSGGKCPKAGQVQTTKGVKYKCTKSGKSLRWVEVVSTATNASATASKGVNGPVGITSWTTTVSPNPVKPGAQFTITSVISCGPIMSITGSPRYPDLRAFSNAQSFAEPKFDVPTLSNGGNTATFTGTATAPTTTGDVKVWTYVRDFGSPNACTGDLSSYKNADGASFLTLTVSNNAASNTTVAGAISKDGGVCTNKGDKSVQSVGYLECRKVSGGILQWFALSNSPSAPVQASGSSDKSLCKLSDQRPAPELHKSVGFPMNTGNIPASGPIKIAFIPIDFADVPGSYAPLSKAQADMDILSSWVTTMSGGRSSVVWVTHNSWLRASMTSGSYPKTIEGTIAQEAFNLADPFINFSGVHTAIVYVPSNIGDGYSGGGGMNLENRNYSTNEGPVKNFINAGAYFYRADKNVLGGWAHMLGHGLGLVDYYVRSWSGDSAQPMAGWEIMGSQDGPSQSLAAWNRWLLGWLTSEQVYCIPKSSLTSTEVVLVPINKDIAGYKAVMIPLTATTVLIVESRRGEGYDSQLGSGAYGVIAYTVDTTIDNGDGLAAVQVPAAHTTELRTAHGNVKDALILVGESITVSGVTVRMIKSGDFDTVQISK